MIRKENSAFARRVQLTTVGILLTMTLLAMVIQGCTRMEEGDMPAVPTEETEEARDAPTAMAGGMEPATNKAIPTTAGAATAGAATAGAATAGAATPAAPAAPRAPATEQNAETQPAENNTGRTDGKNQGCQPLDDRQHPEDCLGTRAADVYDSAMNAAMENGLEDAAELIRQTQQVHRENHGRPSGTSR